MNILVTGGAGFIGSHFVREWIREKKSLCVNLDKLTFAGNLHNLDDVSQQNHYFVRGDMGDRALVNQLLQKHQPVAAVHFAIETHNSAVQTNVDASFAFLEEVHRYWDRLEEAKKSSFRFLNVSTDEVYGSLSPQEHPCKEGHPFAPTTLFAASKAAFDLLLRSYCTTYDFPALTTYSSNNFGPYQFPEKLIPTVIVNAMRGKALPLYGDGLQQRNWIYVKDHCAALRLVLEKGKPGSTYNIGHKGDLTNLELVTHICVLLDALLTESPHRPHTRLMTHIEDFRGHERRYAIDSNKIETELGFKPSFSFDESLLKTIMWYLDHREWVENVLSGSYRTWVTL